MPSKYTLTNMHEPVMQLVMVAARCWLDQTTHATQKILHWFFGFMFLPYQDFIYCQNFF